MVDDMEIARRHAGGMALALDDHDAATKPRPLSPVQARRPERRSGRRTRRALLIAHVLTSVGWFGVAVTVAFCAVVGSSRDDIAFSEVIGATLWLSVPLGLASAVTGVVLGLTTRWGLLRHWWVVAKQAITIAVILTDVLVIGPAIARDIEAGSVGEIPGPVYAHCIVLAIATVLSVWKPRARTPLERRPRSADAD
jgi:hypothetical protein